jgi:hypothetical protein
MVHLYIWGLLLFITLQFGWAQTAGTLDYETSGSYFKFYNGSAWVGTSNGVTANACSPAGKIDYNTTSDQFEFCNGSFWVNMMGTNTAVACSPKGQMRYSGGVYQACSGSTNTWWDLTGSGPPSYSYRRSIDIDYTKVSTTDHTSFPVLISGTYAYLATIANGGKVQSGSGTDIIFTSDSAGLTVLDFEQDYYSATTGQIAYWVRIPTLSSTVNTTIYMFYGKTAASDLSNKNGVWSNSFASVWHMSQSSSTTVPDSTSNARTATKLSANNPASSAGKIGLAETFDGSDTDRLTQSGVTLTNTNTVSGWVYVVDVGNDYQAFATTNDTNYYGYWVKKNTATKWRIDFYNGGDTLSSTNLNLNAWYYISMVNNAGNLTFYVNGAANGTATGIIGYSFKQMGGTPINAADYFHGSLDEMRASTAARSAGWVATEYNNQNSPSTFYSVGAETAL